MRYPKVVVLTGAGISAESGIPVFRSETGLWENHKVEDVATYDGFLKNPNLVHDFYNKMRHKLKTTEPNQGHLALTQLQEAYAKQGGSVIIITQNIDDLHQKAKSNNIIHVHGELNSLLCEHCNKRINFFKDSSTSSSCPYCHKHTMRPDIVWFGEATYHLEEIQEALAHCDLFLAIGTSGVVYPAAGFAAFVRAQGKPCIEFNLEPSQVHSAFSHAFYGKAGTTLPLFVNFLLKYDRLPESQTELNSMQAQAE